MCLAPPKQTCDEEPTEALAQQHPDAVQQCAIAVAHQQLTAVQLVTHEQASVQAQEAVHLLGLLQRQEKTLDFVICRAWPCATTQGGEEVRRAWSVTLQVKQGATGQARAP